MTKSTRLEKIADDYIEDYLWDHPINDFSLESDLEDYTENIQGKNEIMHEYLESEKSRNIEVEINKKLRDTTDITPGLLDILLENIQSVRVHNRFVGELMQLVIVSDKSRVRDMEELRESEQDNPLSSDTWIYHKDWDLKKVTQHIQKENDLLRIEDEIEEGNSEDVK